MTLNFFLLQISLCDDYSLPVDNLGNRKRPNSIAVPSFTEWNIASPNEEKVRLRNSGKNVYFICFDQANIAS